MCSNTQIPNKNNVTKKPHNPLQSHIQEQLENEICSFKNRQLLFQFYLM